MGDYRSFCEDHERRQKLKEKREETETKEELDKITQSPQASARWHSMVHIQCWIFHPEQSPTDVSLRSMDTMF